MPNQHQIPKHLIRPIRIVAVIVNRNEGTMSFKLSNSIKIKKNYKNNIFTINCSESSKSRLGGSSSGSSGYSGKPSTQAGSR